MNLIKLVVIAALIGGGYTYYNKQQAAKSAAQNAQNVAAQEAGFVPLPAADGHEPGTVVVLAPDQCTRAEARRAEKLVSDLSSRGISVRKSNNIGFSRLQPDQVEQVNAVMSGPIPIVFVRGSAKANPTLDEVIAQYRGR